MANAVYDRYWELVGAKSHYEFDRAIQDLVLNKEERESLYKGLLKIDYDLSKDSFKDYFEEYGAERKTNQQDYTPREVANILSQLTYSYEDVSGYTASDMTAGTGTLLIEKWWQEMISQTPWTYAPHRYFYFAQEFGDNVIHYLIHNLAIRGMNAIVIHGDTLNQTAKQIYFIQNSKDDFMSFSDINVLPHSDEIKDYFKISEWVEDEIHHIESGEVLLNKAFPRIKKEKPKEVPYDPKQQSPLPWRNATRLKDVAFVERAKKGKIYKKGSIIIQVSATSGEHGLLESDGEVEAQFVVATLKQNIGYTSDYLFLYLGLIIPHWFHLRQQGLNMSFKDIEDTPLIRF